MLFSCGVDDSPALLCYIPAVWNCNSKYVAWNKCGFVDTVFCVLNCHVNTKLFKYL